MKRIYISSENRQRQLYLFNWVQGIEIKIKDYVIPEADNYLQLMLNFNFGAEVMVYSEDPNLMKEVFHHRDLAIELVKKTFKKNKKKSIIVNVSSQTLVMQYPMHSDVSELLDEAIADKVLISDDFGWDIFETKELTVGLRPEELNFLSRQFMQVQRLSNEETEKDISFYCLSDLTEPVYKIEVEDEDQARNLFKISSASVREDQTIEFTTTLVTSQSWTKYEVQLKSDAKEHTETLMEKRINWSNTDIVSRKLLEECLFYSLDKENNPVLLFGNENEAALIEV